ncbi:MAG TPA: NAD(P)-dependent oxidoreductase [Nitrospira sp.]|nr:NAD(P)-dependent oxidoreductase [Nitrospira sp.]
MNTVVVTGATGMIGRNLLPLLSHQFETWGICRHQSQAPNVRVIEHDLTQDHLPSSLPDRVDSVIHLAQSAHFREFPEQANDIFKVNVASTQSLLDWARRRKAKRFIYASSGGIYGHGAQAFREDDVSGTKTELGYYLASKNCGELLVENYASCFTVVILRFFFVYGPGQRDSMLIPRLVRSVEEGRPIVLHGLEGIRINPIHVRDAVRCIDSALKLEASQKINVAGSEIVTLKAIAEQIGELVGKQPVFEQQNVSPRHLIGDTERMCRLLVRPAITLKEGLSELV